VAALIGTPILLFAALTRGSLGFFIGVIVFTVTTLLLYFGSMLYHAWPQTRAKSLLQVLDHSAIFWLIAGTYTPFALGPLHGVWGWTILGLIWAFAVLISWNGGVGFYSDPASHPRGSGLRTGLASGRWRRVYSRRVIFR